MIIYLLGCVIVTLALVFFLYKIGIGKRYIIFAGFALFGLLAGTFSGLAEHREGLISYNILGVYLGDEVYSYAINHIGDPHSSQAHYTIPWVFRIPQVYLFTSLASYSLLGLIIQMVYNRVKKPITVPRPRAALITLIAFIVCIGISTGVVYATQSEYERYKTASPYAYPVVVIGTSSTDDSEWNVLAECDVKEVS